ncbi:MAG: hypothetical protein WDN01_11590 [Rhizomicrobium sp.]
MNKAGWVDVWHLVVAIMSRQPPFVQIMCATGVVFIAVMAVEGLRTSLAAIWRAHRAPPVPAPVKNEPVALAAPAAAADAPATRAFSVRSVPRAAATSARKRKPLTVAARQFRSPRPTIRRHPMLDFASAGEMPHFSADTVLQHEGV